MRGVGAKWVWHSSDEIAALPSAVRTSWEPSGAAGHLVGYRFANRTLEPDRFRPLSSHCGEFGLTAEAECWKHAEAAADHAAPTENCTCGFHSLSISDFRAFGPYASGGVQLRVALSGKVVIRQWARDSAYLFRAQRQRVIALRKLGPTGRDPDSRISRTSSTGWTGVDPLPDRAARVPVVPHLSPGAWLELPHGEPETWPSTRTGPDLVSDPEPSRVLAHSVAGPRDSSRDSPVAVMRWCSTCAEEYLGGCPDHESPNGEDDWVWITDTMYSRAYHHRRDCEALIAGQDRVLERSGTPAQPQRVRRLTAVSKGKGPCRHCATPAEIS